jgi:uncharacterized membrane protein
MNKEWQADLRTLEMVQADLRRRLDGLDRQIAALRSQLAAEDARPTPSPVIPQAPSAPLPPSRPPVLPPPLPDLPRAEVAPTPPPCEVHVPPPAAAKENLELQVGRYWLVRIGILVLLTGLVLLGNLAYQNLITKLGAPGKLGLLYLAGAALAVLGFWLEKRRESLRYYARVLMAGGAATVYYTTYAAHFVAPLRVIENPVLGGLALLLLAGGLAWFAERRRSEGVAFTAVLLSYYTSAINPAANFTLFSNAVLAGVAVFLLARHRWFGVSWLALAGSYGSFAYWRMAGGGDGGGFWLTHGFLPAYWIIFTAAVFLHRAETFQKAHRETFLTANNAAFFALAAPAFHARHPDQFWLFALVSGVVLLGLAGLARRMRREDPAFDGTYLAQGLILVTVALAARFSGYQLAVLLAVESSALLFLSAFRHRLLFCVGAGLAASGAFVLSLEALARPSESAWIVGVVVGALLAGNGVLLKARARAFRVMQWSRGTAAWAWPGLILLLAVLCDRFRGDALLWAFLAAALLPAVTLRWHRLPEIAVGAQGFLTGALVLLVASLNLTPGWQNAFPALVCALALMHWWRSQAAAFPRAGRLLEGADALAACVVLAVWLRPDGSDDAAMLPLVLTGLGVLVYGAATRAVVFAILGQVFTLAGIAVCLRALIWGGESWSLTLGTIGLVAIQVVCVSWLARGALKNLAALYRAILAGLVIAWLLEYVPDAWQFLSFVLAGVLVFIPAALRRQGEYLGHAAVLVAVGAFCYLDHIAGGTAGSGPDFLALLALLFFQQAGRRWLAKTGWFPAEMQAGLAIAALGGLWFQSSRWAWDSSSGLAVTVVWALLAFGALGAGFLLRERVYRLMGLLILAVAVGHVFFVDVWKMGQVAGILGIIGLAVVLLALGFIYNRFADQIRKWL